MIDDYDSFVSRTIAPDFERIRSQTGGFVFLKAFYAALKAAAANARRVAKIFITGVSSVALDSLTSGFNIALNVSSHACFNEYAGFTAAELAELIPELADIKQLGVSAYEIIARMEPVYGGYCFSQWAESAVFNSSMCLYYLGKMRREGRFLPPEDYLDPACDSDGAKLQKLFEKAEDGLADEIIAGCLKNDRFFIEKLAENINLDRAARYDYDRLLSVLYYHGYLTIDRDASDDSALALKVPNVFMSKVFARRAANART